MDSVMNEMMGTMLPRIFGIEPPMAARVVAVRRWTSKNCQAID